MIAKNLAEERPPFEVAGVALNVEVGEVVFKNPPVVGHDLLQSGTVVKFDPRVNTRLSFKRIPGEQLLSNRLSLRTIDFQMAFK